MRNITRSPFQRGAQPRKAIMPANSYAEGGLTSIPRYAEGDEVEAEETSTGEDILEFITNFGGAAGGPTISDIVEYFSEERGGDPTLEDAIRQLMGMPKGMSKGGVVPGSNPVQGTVGGPTVGFNAPGGLQQKYEADARFLNSMLGITPREWKESYGSSFPSSYHQGSDAVTRAILSKVKQRTPPAAPVEDSKPRPTLPQTFAELDTSVAVENPATYVAGPSGEPLESLEALFDLYHTNPNVTNVTNITGTEDPEDPDYAAQAAELYAGGEPTGLGLSQPGGLNLPELLKLAGITT